MSIRKILLADDSIAIQKVVKLTFADEGIDVITVGDGDSALARIGDEAPDLVIADVNMPGANGYQICEHIRADNSLRDLPVVLLVGSFEPFDEAEAQRVGANSFMTKPFQSIRQLVATVMELIDSRASVVETEKPDADELESVQRIGSFEETGDAKENEDIDSLYKESVPEKNLAAPVDDPEAYFEDAATDDEMIETSYADNYQREGTAEFEIVSEQSTEGEETETEETVIEETPVLESFHHEEPAESGSQPEENPAESFGYDDLPATEEFTKEQKSDITFRPVGPATFGDETIRFEVVKEIVSQENYQFDEVNLLELPPPESGGIEFTTPASAIEAGSNKQVVSLSPELLEVIVQKVVEKLSNKY